MFRLPLSGIRRAARLAALALVTAGCDTPTEPGDPPRDLAAARALWERTRPAAYDFTVTPLCFCASRPLAVSVSGGRVVAVRDPATGGAITPAPYETVLTVDALFAYLDDAVSRGAAQVTAEYDPARGYPVRTYVDYQVNLADEELGFAVSDFTAR